MYELNEAYLEIYDEFRPLTTEATFHGKMPGRAIQTRATPSGNYTSSRNEPDQRDAAMKSTLKRMKTTANDENKSDDERSVEVKATRASNKISNKQKTPSRGITHDEKALRRQAPNGKRKVGTSPGTAARKRLKQIRQRLDRDPIKVVYDNPYDHGRDVSSPQAIKNNERYQRITNALKRTGEWGQKHEEIEYLLNLLVTEGYADNYDSAISIIEAMSEEWFESILQEAPLDEKFVTAMDYKRKGPDHRTTYPGLDPKKLGKNRNNPNFEMDPEFFKTRVNVNDRKLDPYYEGGRRRRAERNKARGGFVVREELEFVIETLINDCYADDYDSAISIIESMSEEWFESILQEAPWQIVGPDPHGPSDSEKRPIGKPYQNKKEQKIEQIN